MALDFPPGTPGATYTGPNGVIWSWDGVKWISGTGTTVYAPITDAALQGQPTAPTPPAGDADTSIATTAFVTNAVATSLHDVGRNYLHNSMMNIAQRGAGPFTTSVYTLDRWALAVVSDTVSVLQFAMTDANRAQIGDEAAVWLLGNQFTGSAAAGAFSVVFQSIEDARRLAGKTVTVSFYAQASGALKLGVSVDQNMGDGGSPSANVYNAGQTVQLAASWARYSLTFTLASLSGKTLGTNSNSRTVLNFWYSSGANQAARAGNVGVQGPNATINIWGVQLELGPTATPLEKLDPVTQLQQCQRFFQVVSCSIRGNGASAISLFTNMMWPQMRAVPVATLLTAGTRTNVTVGGISMNPYFTFGGVFGCATAAAGDGYIMNELYTLSADL